MAAAVILTLAASLQFGSAAAQVSNQSFEITSSTPRPTVGDSVVLAFRVRLDERDLLFDTIPRPIGDLPPGVRILSVEKLQRTPDRIFHGHARIAFYRPGRQPVPVFGLPFMRAVKGVQRATLASDSLFVNVAPLLPAGNPALKDIAGLEQTGGPSLLPWLAGVALLLGLVVFSIRYRQRLKRRPSSAPTGVPAIQPPSPPTPYEIALEALRRIERENWVAQEQPARYYASVTDTLRDYLEAAEGVPARERTSAEVLWALPPHLSEPSLRQRLEQLLEQADLVKFARLRPEPSAATQFLQQCRSLLESWHESQVTSALVDAIR